MSTPLFSVVAIMKNEEKVLPRLLDSLKPYFDAGGDVSILDTGSSDNSVAVAKSYGCKVEEVGEKYLLEITNPMGINQQFVVEGEKQLVKKGDKYFNFSAARNHTSSLAKNDYVFFYDCDEISVTLDIEAINKFIQEGMTQSEYNFVFAYDQWNNEVIKFVQCKAYDRRYMEWRGIVHELICGKTEHTSKRIFLEESIYKLGHYQNHESGRHIYLKGLAQDSFNNPLDDRHLHYLCREMLWSGMPKSALKGFKRHLTLGGWAAERAESLLFMSDIYGQFNDPQKQAECCSEAFYLDSSRNSALIKLALFFRHNGNSQAAICYAKAALEIPYNGFYADNLDNYRHIPHEILYTSYGRMPQIEGYIDKAKFHLDKCLEYLPYHQQYLFDTRYYNEFGAPMIDGWMRWPEIKFLYSEAKKHAVIVEIGAWKGRGTTAICSGNKNAKVFSVDTWAGSQDERDLTHDLAKQEDIYQTFLNNTKQFGNLTPIRKTSVEAAKDFEDNSIDWVFIDAGHTKPEVKEDVAAWLPKVKFGGIISGHDYEPSVWMQVCEAVNEMFPDRKINVVDSIWWVINVPANTKEGYYGIQGVSGDSVNEKDVRGEATKDLINYSEEHLLKIDGLPPLPLFRDGKQVLNEPLIISEELIPRRIYTCWLGDTVPDLVQKCIDSQIKMCNEFGYEHVLITLQNIPKDSVYIQQCLASTHPNGVKYCKATDYLRVLFLKEFGGIFIDSDIEILDGRSFDAMLSDQMFVGLETADWANGKVVLGTAVVGAIRNHPMIEWWLNEIETRFRGDTNDNYESSMDLLNKGGVAFQHLFRLYEPDFFFPYEWLVSGKTTITENTICVHHFLRTWTPQSTLQQFKYNIENNINFTFVKRGDGEVACMNGESGGNCDGHPYSPGLAQALKDAYSYLHSAGATIVEFEDQKNYNVLLHRTDNNLEELAAFYKAIQKSERPKLFIAPQRLLLVTELLKADQVMVPEVNAYAQLDVLLRLSGEWLTEHWNDPIVIVCAGMPAKSLIRHLHNRNPHATYLDCGSAFDPAVSETRTFQISKDEFNRLYSYSGIDDSDMNGTCEPEPQIDASGRENYFHLEQETHPEKIWAMVNVISHVGKFYDLGCGTHKTHACAIGMDIRPVTDIQGSIDELPFEEDSAVDSIISRHSLEHVLDPVKALREWTRVLKPGGKMIIVLPDHEFINTIDPYYSNGEHLHAYTRDSFKNLLSLFPELAVSKTETVLENWSFGTVVYKLPRVSILLPHITGSREDGLQRCLQSIKNLNYPTNLIETMLIEGGGTVPEKIASGLNDATGDVIAYAANDMIYSEDSMRIAITDMLELNKGMVSFNEGNILPDRGNEATHFVISKELISKLERGELFSLDLNHVGVDNFLVAQVEKLSQYHHSRDAHITHNHFSHGNEFDSTYQKGWSKVNEDRVTLERKLKELNANGAAIL